MKTWKKLVSCLLVLSMIASMFVVVTAEEADQPEASDDPISYDNCVDEKGDPLNPYIINNDIWVEENGGIKMPTDRMFSFLLFDTPLTTNRVEATFENITLSGSDDRNGIVFALTDHDPGATLTGEGDTNVSYYWAFISGWGGRIGVLKMGKYNNWTQLSADGNWGIIGPSFAELGIDPVEGVTLAAEWDDNGHIKVYANGTLIHDITDTTGTPLTGDFYGVLTRRWDNSTEPNANREKYTDTLTSFVTGDAKLAITATAEEGGTVAGGADNFYRGQSATVTATVNEGYNFVGWYENDQLVSSDLAYTFKVTGNRDLVAKFTKNTYTVTVTAENGTATGGGTFGEGAEVTVTATANTGYKFVGWYQNGAPNAVSTDATYTFTVTTNCSLTAKFEKVEYTVPEDGQGNKLNPYYINGNTWIEENGTMKPAPGTMENFIFFDNALANNRIEATFRNLPYTGEGNTRNGIVFAVTDNNDDHLTGIEDGGANYYWVCVSGYGEVQLIGFPGWKNYTTGGIVDITKDVTLAVEWDAEGNVKVFANGELRIEKNVGEPLTGNLYGMLMRSYANTEEGGFTHNILATSFVAGGANEVPKQVTVTVDPTDAGSVTGAGDYYLGQNVTLTATPNEGYSFVGWLENGKLVSSDTTYTFKVTADHNLTASFTTISYTVTVTPEENGTTAGSGTFGENAEVTVTATPNTGYKFVGWYENDVLIPDAGATYTFEVTADRNLTAKFEKITYSIAVDGEGDVLNPYFVNGVVWVEEDGKLKMPAGHENSFLLFDTPIANKRVEATIVINDNIFNDGNHRNGIVFAFEDEQGDATVGDIYLGEDLSYYWAFVNDWGCLQLFEMGKNVTWDNANIGGLSVDLKWTLGIDPAQGVTIAAEWDDNGHIKVFANDYLVFDIVDETPLTGSLYGLLVNKWGNSTDGIADGRWPYNAPVTSFVAGGALATKDVVVDAAADSAEGGTVTGAGDYYLGENVTLTATPNEGYKFVGWLENGEIVSKEATMSFSAKTSRTLTAQFVSFDDYQHILVESTETNVGDEVVVTLVIKNNPGIAGLVVSLNYNADVLTLIGAENGTLFSGFTWAENMLWDEEFNVTEDGVLATLTFAVAEGAELGDYTIEVIVQECYDVDTEVVDLATISGTVTVNDAPDITWGDANDDGVIDTFDIVSIAKYVANYNYSTGTSTEVVGLGADANGDGVIDTFDIVSVAKYVANYNYSTGTSTEVLGPQ